MGTALRLLVVDHADHVYRLDVAKFDRMLDSPKTTPIPALAGQRIRPAEAVVDLIERKAACLVRKTFSILTFDQGGCLDKTAFEEQQFSQFASWAPTVLEPKTGIGMESGVVDARYRFADRGGRWVPSEALLRAMHEAVLGNVSVPRL
jgi:hypothetical protein